MLRLPPPNAVKALAWHVLLCSLNRPDDWPIWLDASGATHIDGNSGLKFENAALPFQVALENWVVARAQPAQGAQC